MRDTAITVGIVAILFGIVMVLYWFGSLEDIWTMQTKRKAPYDPMYSYEEER